MTNKEILTALKNKRDISNFARFLNITRPALYNILKSPQIKHNQYYNFMQFIKAQYLSK